ncbi:hypothetical protein [Bacillus sp. B-jedd]|uniref:hypothetical protein n=1 Tax=Bacillus sp. B-jedd TaxID=1476857 RepID=UPI0005155F37|nr:hypothetical protein [Bacillus sp. B-jedd]CEG26546.1 hypothetical protein BN1002_01394 [Bacillus sp. B-jedd]
MGIIGSWVESLDYQFEILRERCVRHISPLSGCEKCANACGEEAIIFSDGKPTIDAPAVRIAGTVSQRVRLKPLPASSLPKNLTGISFWQKESPQA